MWTEQVINKSIYVYTPICIYILTYMQKQNGGNEFEGEQREKQCVGEF